ncbi:Nramp family divalent metal transporter [Spirosoma taeanense]|uniref:Nramp family divalent metal transporter n=1 Tax=Spirosoma taeanense TaxID=2735870 RepID=A0A6M5Y8I8_9BACT|nr:Nramp family divalent metal transporter [Spirosoma taeanense]QJW90608.1 Nramp family divalent metal transporter [Spirosoma taeanense]
MPKSLTLRSGVGSVLFWSVISAAFIGPGSVTACAMAGSRFGLSLLWALTFSTLSTILLQEAAARITLASGLSFGEVITHSYGAKAPWIARILFIAISVGCAAYQAGNILGAVAGLSLLTHLPTTGLTIAVGVVCVTLLWQGSTRLIANFLGLIVFAMGIAFAYVAFNSGQSTGTFLKALVVPSLPADSLVLVISLIGTTIVPYNLFLGSGLSTNQTLREMRWGIGLAVLIGGLTSMAILAAGTLVTGEFSFQSVAQTMSAQLGDWAGALFAFGLFAAGFTSTLTAPLASAVTAQSLLGWSAGSTAYRAVWLLVMAVGLTFGLLGVRPIPIIIAVQAINGILLPFVTVFLFRAVNNQTLLGQYRNSPAQNVAMGFVVLVTAGLGGWNLWLALGSGQ